MKITGNEPAMPTDIFEADKEGNGERNEYPGLTIRQQFAMAAMQGLMAVDNKGEHEVDNLMSIAARLSVAAADALIAELNKATE